MKSIKLFIKPENGELLLPFAHSEHLQGLFYALLSHGSPELADEIHKGSADSKYKFFSFGDIQGNSTANSESKTVVFTGTVEWEIRSMQDEIIDAILSGISDNRQIELYTNSCTVTGYKVIQRSFLSDEFIFRMNTPLTVYITDDERHTIYFDVNDDPEAFANAVMYNLAGKYSDYYNEEYEEEMAFEFIGKRHQKVVTVYKNTIVNAFFGVYKLIASPKMLEIAYYAGVGAKNPAGFGFVDDK